MVISQEDSTYLVVSWEHFVSGYMRLMCQEPFAKLTHQYSNRNSKILTGMIPNSSNVESQVFCSIFWRVLTEKSPFPIKTPWFMDHNSKTWYLSHLFLLHYLISSCQKILNGFYKAVHWNVGTHITRAKLRVSVVSKCDFQLPFPCERTESGFAKLIWRIRFGISWFQKVTYFSFCIITICSNHNHSERYSDYRFWKKAL